MQFTTTRTGCVDTSTNNQDRLAAPAPIAISVLPRNQQLAGGDPLHALKSRLQQPHSKPKWRQKRRNRSISNDRRSRNSPTLGSSSAAGYGNFDVAEEDRKSQR